MRNAFFTGGSTLSINAIDDPVIAAHYDYVGCNDCFAADASAWTYLNARRGEPK